ncbi:hypothetical protein ABFP25_06450 [Acinetobacter indicus]|jgi:hypothetical protein|nr:MULTISPECIES: hypothetical protein [Acinetobacter]KJV45020.1 hypothetical protein VH96_04975 [Acinetobacter indicus]MCO8087047.1 hypothetical protein [Acinetobacter indicus]MCO8098913.1 hypothetical protein [Acinetobacter indicus]MCO8101999.1 hypothetical protein [Acinetobacter indicus]MCO8104485.1 hypothetical protein [Acinetobacter indicus]
MNNKMIGALTLPLLCLALTGCDRMPAECEEAWDKMDSLSTKMGLSEEQRQFQKKQFEAGIKEMSTEDAKRLCSQQTQTLGIIGQ